MGREADVGLYWRIEKWLRDKTHRDGFAAGGDGLRLCAAPRIGSVAPGGYPD
jgi:hypothetical protein